MTSNRFDKKAKEFDANPVIHDMASEFATTLKNNIPLSSEMRAMDFGCGIGLISLHLCSDLGSIMMIDSSQGMLDILEDKIKEQNIANMTVRNCSIDELVTENETFDLIYTNNVLHHIEDIPELISKISRLLKSGGYICIGDLKTEDATFHTDTDEIPHFGFDETELSNTLKAHGFENINWEHYFTITKPNKHGNIQSYPLFFMQAKKH